MYLEESKSHLPVFALDESCVGFKLLDKGILQKRDDVDVVSRLMTDQLFLPDHSRNKSKSACISCRFSDTAARTSAISEKDVVDPTKDDEGVQFFTPSTEKLIEEISAASQTTVIDGASPTGCKRVLSFGVVQKATATVKFEPIDDDTLMQSMIGSSHSVESQVKKTKGKLKQN